MGVGAAGRRVYTHTPTLDTPGTHLSALPTPEWTDIHSRAASPPPCTSILGPLQQTVVSGVRAVWHAEALARVCGTV